MALTREQQIKMFGCTQEGLDTPPLFPVRKEMLIMSILSDAQEEIARGNGERARQYINRAKYFLSNDSRPPEDQCTNCQEDCDFCHIPKG